MALTRLQATREVRKLHPGVGGAELRNLVNSYIKNNKVEITKPTIKKPTATAQATQKTEAAQATSSFQAQQSQDAEQARIDSQRKAWSALDPKQRANELKAKQRANFLEGINKAFGNMGAEDKNRIISEYDKGTLDNTTKNQVMRYVQSDAFGEVVKPSTDTYTAPEARSMTKTEILEAMDDDPVFKDWSNMKKRSVAAGYLDPNRNISDTWSAMIDNAVSPYMAGKGMTVDANGGVIPVSSGDNLTFGDDLTDATAGGISDDTGIGDNTTGSDKTDPYKDAAEKKERMNDALAEIADALATGKITQNQADAFKAGIKGWDFNKEINMDNIISEFDRIKTNTIDPQFSYVIGDTISQIQDAKTELDRNKETRFKQEQTNLEARGRTQSGLAVKQLGELAAQGQAGQVGELQKDYTNSLTGIRRLAEGKLGSEGAQKIGFDPIQGGFEGTIKQQQSGVEAGVASSLFNQGVNAGNNAAPVSQKLIPDNLYTL